MGTRYLFEKAVKISQNLSPPEKGIVKNLCHDIRKSQEELIAAADDAMCRCIMQCKGICCRSLDIDSIFILILKPGLKDEMQQRLTAHSPLYLSPCPFLMGGKGPCMFHRLGKSIAGLVVMPIFLLQPVAVNTKNIAIFLSFITEQNA